MARWFYDLTGGDCLIKDLIFNEELDANGDTKVYDGAFVKLMDYDDIDHGKFITLMNNTTIYENQIGIICEEVAASGDTYLPDAAAATGTYQRKKISVSPTAVYLVEYVQKDRAGTANTDTGLAIAAAATVSTTSPNLGANDGQNGAWFYMLDGANAGYLHYILDSANSATAGIAVLRTAAVNAIVATDTFLSIEKAFEYAFDLNATYTDLKSEMIIGSRDDRLKGIDHWISSPGIPFQKLHASKHDGLKIDNARFYHEVALANPYFTSVLANASMIVS
jgi:hypothetical protein